MDWQVSGSLTDCTDNRTPMVWINVQYINFKYQSSPISSRLHEIPILHFLKPKLGRTFVIANTFPAT